MTAPNQRPNQSTTGKICALLTLLPLIGGVTLAITMPFGHDSFYWAAVLFGFGGILMLTAGWLLENKAILSMAVVTGLLCSLYALL